MVLLFPHVLAHKGHDSEQGRIHPAHARRQEQRIR